MIYLYIFLGLIAALFLFSFLSVGRIPKYEGISYSDLSRYLAYLLEKALANGGNVHIQPEGMKGVMNITKREYVKKPAKVFITLSSGYIPRNDIAKVSERLKRDGIDHKLHYTNYHHALHRLTLGISFRNAFVAEDVLNAIRSIVHTLCTDSFPAFTVTVYGPLKRGYLHEDGDVVKNPTSFVIGRVMGIFIGRLFRFFRGF